MFRKKITIQYKDPFDYKIIKDMFKVIPKNYPPYFGAIPKTMFNPFTGHARPDQKTIKSCSKAHFSHIPNELEKTTPRPPIWDWFLKPKWSHPWSQVPGPIPGPMSLVHCL